MNEVQEKTRFMMMHESDAVFFWRNDIAPRSHKKIQT